MEAKARWRQKKGKKLKGGEKEGERKRRRIKFALTLGEKGSLRAVSFRARSNLSSIFIFSPSSVISARITIVFFPMFVPRRSNRRLSKTHQLSVPGFYFAKTKTIDTVQNEKCYEDDREIEVL